jgi:hypothetical protein
VVAGMIIADAGQAGSLTVPQGSSVLLDNRCDPAEWKDANRFAIADGVQLALKQDAQYLYLCMRLPALSYGTTDVYLQPATGSAPWNLHASAQIGEKQRTDAGWPAEWTFGNQRDWYSPAVPFRGVREVKGGVSASFAPIEGREIQIGRARFGPGPWRLMFELRALGKRQDREARYPVGASIDDPSGWAELRFVD